ncbi:MAG: hypothetical protein AB8B63_25340 [Granulosicoccus sp.]
MVVPTKNSAPIETLDNLILSPVDACKQYGYSNPIRECVGIVKDSVFIAARNLVMAVVVASLLIQTFVS